MRAREACGAGEGFLMLGELGLNADGKDPVEKAPLEMAGIERRQGPRGIMGSRIHMTPRSTFSPPNRKEKNSIDAGIECSVFWLL